jgi:hypothetical protein
LIDKNSVSIPEPIVQLQRQFRRIQGGSREGKDQQKKGRFSHANAKVLLSGSGGASALFRARINRRRVWSEED